MADEWMTNEERFEAAIALDTVDRHPVFPILVTTVWNHPGSGVARP
ncbi:MAG: hypothetical protein JRI73_08570 [Deltaproteobacteria bacterium]|nr:hypothetical protein [Deltaproteobacteria bacterium]